MPILQKEEIIDRFYLPSTENLPEADKAWVDMDISKLTTEDVTNMDSKASEISIGIGMLTGRIKGWNFTDANGVPLPVSEETVRLLDIEDFGFLSTKIPTGSKELDPEEKKS